MLKLFNLIVREGLVKRVLISDIALYLDRKFPNARAHQLARIIGELYASDLALPANPPQDIVFKCS